MLASVVAVAAGANVCLGDYAGPGAYEYNGGQVQHREGQVNGQTGRSEGCVARSTGIYEVGWASPSW